MDVSNTQNPFSIGLLSSPRMTVNDRAATLCHMKKINDVALKRQDFVLAIFLFLSFFIMHVSALLIFFNAKIIVNHSV